MFIEEIIGAFTGQNRRDKHRAVAAGTILGIMGGLLAGGAAGVLFAPKAGAETREEIGEAAVKGYNTVKDKAQEVGEKVSATVNEVGEKVSSKVSETYSQFKENMSDTAREARKAARQARRHARNIGDTVAEAAEDIGEEVEEAVEDVKS